MSAHNHIFLVEDDLDLADAMQEYLQREGFCVSVVHEGISAVEQIVQQQPDLVVLDVMLPGKDGVQVCREVRDEYAGFIVMLTAREDEIDQIVGLELGADDYLFKPVKPRFLLAKIKAFLRRTELAVEDAESADNAWHFGSLRIDPVGRCVYRHAQLVQLTSMEYELLILLVERAGQAVSRDQISRALKGVAHDGLERSIDNWVSHLRKKLGDHGKYPTGIKTIRLKGYAFSPNGWPEVRDLT